MPSSEIVTLSSTAAKTMRRPNAVSAKPSHYVIALLAGFVTGSREDARICHCPQAQRYACMSGR